MASIFETDPNPYLLIPANPTPNGRLHLGHMAGPYLRMDILARHLRRRGASVQMIFGTDPYDIYVALRAEQEGRSPAQVANRYYEEIIHDLDALQIGYDVVINPVDPLWDARYRAMHLSIMEELERGGRAVRRSNAMPWSRKYRRVVTGPWLAGSCPDCGAEVGGFKCEACGAYFPSSEMRNPRASWGEALDEFVEMPGWFLQLDDYEVVLRQLAASGVPRQFSDIVQRHVMARGGWHQLTQMSSWGIPLRNEDDGHPRSLLSAGHLYTYSLLCGEVWAERTGVSKNAYDEDSGVVVVSGFGLDNVLSHLFGKLAFAAALPGRKPGEHFIINHFYNLEGAKFSTSRRHVIWAKDIVDGTPISVDGLRLTLARTSPTEGPNNFDVHEMVEEQNRLHRDVGSRILSWQRSLNAGQAPEPGSTLVEAVVRSMKEQSDALACVGFDPARAASVLLEWVNRPPAADPYWLLKGFGLLAAPLMPGLAGDVWRKLGHSEGAPTVGAFFERTAPMIGNLLRPFAPLTVEDLAECLPEALRSSRGSGV